MTKRARLSLDPGQRSKAPPPHGFDPEADDAAPPDATGGAASTAEPARAAPLAASYDRPKRAGGRWRAHRPQSEPQSEPRPEPEPEPGAAAARAPDAATGIGSPAFGASSGTALLAHLRALSRRPVVRAIAVGVAAGVSLYLLRRRLF